MIGIASDVEAVLSLATRAQRGWSWLRSWLSRRSALPGQRLLGGRHVIGIPSAASINGGHLYLRVYLLGYSRRFRKRPPKLVPQMTVPLWPGIETGGQVCGREVAKCQQFEPREELGDPTCLIVLLLDDHHAGMAACKAVRERSIGMGALVNGQIQAHGAKGRVYDIPVAPISLLLSNGQLLEHEAELVPPAQPKGSTHASRNNPSPPNSP